MILSNFVHWANYVTCILTFWICCVFFMCFNNCLILLNHLLVSRWPLGFRMPHEVATDAWREGQLTQLSQVSSIQFQHFMFRNLHNVAYLCSCNLQVFACDEHISNDSHSTAYDCTWLPKGWTVRILQHVAMLLHCSTFFTEVGLTFYDWRFYTWRWREQESFWACSLEELSALATFANQRPSMSLQAAYLV